MTNSILMTVHDREPEVLLSTLRGLARCGFSDSELVIVDDRSSMDYSWVRSYAEPRFERVKWVSTGGYEGFRAEGYGNPAHAFNTGLVLCTGECVCVMSSDVIVTPSVRKSLDRFYDGKSLYTPLIIDLDTWAEYCGPKRPFPMPWFLAMPTALAQSMGGWDEAYLDGLCYEDNDFVGRMALHLGVIKCDWEARGYHQSHIQPAYDVKSDEIMAANSRNRDLTKKKWGGIPFDGESACFTVTKRPDPAGCVRLEVVNEALKEQFFGAKA